jgi:ABC-type transport system involved in multi-copper enzyme maturation permease subunit
MSGSVHLEDGPATAPAPAGPVAHPGAWHVTWHGVRTVTRLELRQRVRSTRWIVALVVWFVVVGAITLLTTGALRVVTGGDPAVGRGPILFAVVSFLVLGLGLLVTPTLTSTTVNGDRNAGTLATLQVTLLSPAEIVLGKVLAAWIASLAFLVVSLPFFLLALGLGGTPVRSLVVVLLLIAALLAALCGIGVGFSALTARTAGSTVLTFAVVTGLAVFTPILFGVTYPSIHHEETVQVWGDPAMVRDGSTAPSCQLWKETRTVYHTERTWWLLALNPFVVVADGSTVPAAASAQQASSPFDVLRSGVREVRQGANRTALECWDTTGVPVAPPPGVPGASTAPIWPWGLGFTVLLGAAGVATAVRRLSIPQRTLPRATRIA